MLSQELEDTLRRALALAGLVVGLLSHDGFRALARAGLVVGLSHAGLRTPLVPHVAALASASNPVVPVRVDSLCPRAVWVLPRGDLQGALHDGALLREDGCLNLCCPENRLVGG